MISDILSRMVASRFFKASVGLLLLLLMAAQALPQMIDSKPYVVTLAALVADRTGARLAVKGMSQIQILPTPALLLESVELSQPEADHSPVLTAESLELELDLFSLLTGEPAIGKLILTAPVMGLEKNEQNAVFWGFLNPESFRKLSSNRNPKPIALELREGRITLSEVKSGSSQELGQLYASGVWGKDSQLSGSFLLRNQPVQFLLARQGMIGATPITLQLASAGNQMTFRGDIDLTADQPAITGKIEAHAADISGMLGLPKEEKQEVSAPAAADSAPVAAAAVPLTFAADYVQKAEGFQLSNIALEAMNSKATGSLEWSGAEAHGLSLHFTSLDFSAVKKLARALIQASNPSEAAREPKALADKSLNLALDITADHIANGKQEWNKALFDGRLADGVLTVNKLALALPGDSNLTFFGLLSVSDTQGLRFEGNTESSGSSLRDLLTVFDPSAAELPDLGLGSYDVRANLFISKELLRLSEADVKLSELALKGGLVAYFDKKARLQADVALHDINFDYFRDNWRKNTPHDAAEQFFLHVDRGMDFSWLKQLSASIDFKVNVQNFTFLERKGKSASFRIFAQNGEIGLYNGRFLYDQDTTEGTLKLDVTGAQPSLNVVLNTAELNTDYFALTPRPPEPAVVPAAKPVAAAQPVAKAKEKAAAPEALPDMQMPQVTAEEDLRQKIAEEAAQMGEPSPADAAAATPAVAEPEPEIESPSAATPAADAPPFEEDLPATPAMPATGEEKAADEMKDEPQETPKDEPKGVWNWLRPFLLRDAMAEGLPPKIAKEDALAPAMDGPAVPADITALPTKGMFAGWSNMPIDMSLLDSINGNFDISVSKLQHKDLTFQNFKMMAKLEQDMLTLKTLTFAHWGGSCSVNGRIFGGKVPGISLGFIVASVDLKELLASLLHNDAIGGRASISGTIDTSGINLQSWLAQATGKILVAARGVTLRGFDLSTVPSAVLASRTAADVLNNVNLGIVRGTGEYSADGSFALQKAVLSSTGIALKTGRIVGNVTGDFRLVPWDVNLLGTFKFPELSTDNVPTMAVRWSGAAEAPSLQTDTQALEAFVSKTITGN